VTLALARFTIALLLLALPYPEPCTTGSGWSPETGRRLEGAVLDLGSDRCLSQDPEAEKFGRLAKPGVKAGKENSCPTL
jgi:hypothetical protein